MKTILRVIEIIFLGIVIYNAEGDLGIVTPTILFGLASFGEGMLIGEEE